MSSVDPARLARDRGPASGRHRPPNTGHRRAAGGGGGRSGGRGSTPKRKGSFWRELPILVGLALVLTIVIQLFIGRLYEIPSGSMEQTLHGCAGCFDDRVATDKMVYRFTDPAPGDVVVFRGPDTWPDVGDTASGQRSENPILSTIQNGLALVGFAAPDESDFVKRVIAVGGQTVACCDAENHVMVDGRPLNEPYLYFEPDRGPPQQQAFAPVVVPPGQLWVMGDNRNNSDDARFNGPIGVTDVIGKARAIVLPVTRWRSVPSINPQTAAPVGP